MASKPKIQDIGKMCSFKDTPSGPHALDSSLPNKSLTLYDSAYMPCSLDPSPLSTNTPLTNIFIPVKDQLRIKDLEIERLNSLCTILRAENALLAAQLSTVNDLKAENTSLCEKILELANNKSSSNSEKTISDLNERVQNLLTEMEKMKIAHEEEKKIILKEKDGLVNELHYYGALVNDMRENLKMVVKEKNELKSMIDQADQNQDDSILGELKEIAAQGNFRRQESQTDKILLTNIVSQKDDEIKKLKEMLRMAESYSFSQSQISPRSEIKSPKLYKDKKEKEVKQDKAITREAIIKNAKVEISPKKKSPVLKLLDEKDYVDDNSSNTPVLKLRLKAVDGSPFHDLASPITPGSNRSKKQSKKAEKSPSSKGTPKNLGSIGFSSQMSRSVVETNSPLLPNSGKSIQKIISRFGTIESPKTEVNSLKAGEIVEKNGDNSIKYESTSSGEEVTCKEKDWNEAISDPNADMKLIMQVSVLETMDVDTTRSPDKSPYQLKDEDSILIWEKGVSNTDIPN